MSYKQNEIIYFYFTIFDTDGITPVTGAVGTASAALRRNGAASGEAVTLAETGSTGRYYASWTPTSLGDYDIEVTNSTDSRVSGPEEPFRVEVNDLDDLATDIAAVPTVAENRTEMDSNSTQLSAILADVTGINGDAMRGTDSASTHSAADVWAVGARTLTSFGTLAADTATAVWAAGARTLTSFGTLIADIWTYVTRTLTAIPTGGATEAKQDTIITDIAAVPTASENTTALWDTAASSHRVAGSMGEIMRFVMANAGGRLKIDDELNQAFLYDSDNVTLLATFNLFNFDGDADYDTVADRQRV